MQSKNRSISPALIIGIISIPIFVGALDLTVVSAVLPQVIYDLEIPYQTGLDDAAWIVSGYLLAYSVAMTFMGRLSDLYGRRRVYLLALGIFALGSYLVATVDTWPLRLVLRLYYAVASGRPDPSQITLWLLIAARVIQAFGAGAMVPVGMALVGDLYPVGKRARMLGVVAALDTAGWVVGHLYGGIVVRYLDWRMIFWLNLPICLLAFILIAYVLRSLPRGSPESRMDWGGAVLIALSLTLFNIALGTGNELGGTYSLGDQSALPPYSVPCLIAALLLMGLFVLRQAHARDPLIPLKLFRKLNFSMACIANFLVGFSLFIAIANVPLFINTLVAQTLEQGAWDSGWLLSALTVPMALATIPGGWISDRRGYRIPAISGLLVAVGGFGLMTSWQPATPYSSMIPHLVLTGLGIGLTMAPIATALINATPLEYRGIASGLVIVFRLIGMTLGISSMMTYGLFRSNAMLAQLAGLATDPRVMARDAINIATTVIYETFLIAGAVCVLALLPVARMKALKARRRPNG
jgi:MFS family permease